ncbi:MAG: hypothetical protein IID32_03795, partial [Planctomycetes bacterium]|nr:hypothetical protein [Planctomycetota bacterium]
GRIAKQDSTKQVNKVPFLGDLPIIGSIFRFEGTELITSELVVFITPTILVDSRLTPSEEKQLAATEIDISGIEDY